MRTIPLQPIPNQQLTINIGENSWRLRIKAITDGLITDVYLNDSPVVLGQRIAVGTPIIPYDYLSLFGNFLLVTTDESLPDWRKLGDSQRLVFIEAV